MTTIEAILQPDTSLSVNETLPVGMSQYFAKHVSVLRAAYHHAALSPIREFKQCLGLNKDGRLFQIELGVDPNDIVTGVHFLARTEDEVRINEVDIFAWENSVEATYGRLKVPESRYLTDYQLSLRGLEVVTNLVTVNVDQFEVVDTVRHLSVPQ